MPLQKYPFDSLESNGSAQAEAGCTAFAFQPPKLRMPSGGVKAFIIAVSQMARAYWPSKETTGLPPLCASPDSLSGWLADEPDKEQVKSSLRQDTRHLASVHSYLVLRSR